MVEEEQIEISKPRIMQYCPRDTENCKKIEEIEKEYNPANIFLDIPYNGYEKEFEIAITSSIKKYGLIPILAEKSRKPEGLLCNVCKSIQKSEYAVADISKIKIQKSEYFERNPNVHYELGIIHSLGKRCCILRHKDTKIPVDLVGLIIDKYESIEHIEKIISIWIENNVEEIIIKTAQQKEIYNFIFYALEREEILDLGMRISEIKAIGDINLLPAERNRLIDMLIGLLKNNEELDHTLIIDALGEVGDERTIEPLVEAFNDKDENVRWRVAEALGVIGDLKATIPLIKALKDESHSVRNKSIEALGKIGDERAISPLIKIMLRAEPLFKLKSDFVRYLREGPISNEIRKLFHEKGHLLSENVQVSGQHPVWIITLNKTNRYRIIMNGNELIVIRIVSDIDEESSKVASEALIKIGNCVISELIRFLKEYKSIGNQAIAEVLGNIGSAAVEPLIDSLSNDHPDVQWTIIKSLGDIRDKRATLPLLKLLKEESGDLESSIIGALGKIGDERAVDDLLKYLDSELDYIRIHTIEALGEIGDSKALEPLFIRLKEGESNEKDWALHALEKVGDPRAVEPIFEHYKRETNLRGGDRRPWAINTHLDNLVDESCLDVLGRFLQDDNEYIRELASHYLLKMGNKSTRVILPALENKILDVRLNAIDLLGELKDRKGTENLIPLIKDPNIHIKKKTIKALNKIHDPKGIIPIANARSEEERGELDYLIDNTIMSWNDPEAIEFFIKLLNHSNKYVQKSVLYGIQHMRHKDTLGPLMKFQKKCKDLDLRKRAIRTICGFEDDEAIVLQKEIMTDPDPEIRKVVLRAQWNNEGNGVCEIICVGLHDPDLEVRKEAIESIDPEVHGDTMILDSLIKTLKNEKDEKIIQESVRRLGEFGDKRAVDTLIDVFRTSEGKTTECILMALFKIDGTKVTSFFLELVGENGKTGEIVESYITGKAESDSLDILINAMKSGSDLTREFVAIALGNIRDSRALEILEEFSEDPNEDIRYNVNWALREIKWENLFQIDGIYNQHLEEGVLKKELVKEFRSNNLTINQTAKIKKINNDTWEVTDGKNRYVIVDSGVALTIYKP